jgi:hypothetical protein
MSAFYSAALEWPAMRLTGVAPVGASLQSIGPTVKLGGNIVGGVVEVVMQGYVELLGIQQVALSTCFRC